MGGSFPLKDTTATTLATVMLNEVFVGMVCLAVFTVTKEPIYAVRWFILSVNCWELPQPESLHIIQRAMAKHNASITR